MEFKPAQCPSCGGSLQLPDDRTSVNCMYCGGTVVVREAIQAAAAASIPNLLKLATAAAQSHNHQEAYHYYTKALELDSHNSEAWAGKAEAAGLLSTQHSFRIPEMMNYFATSLEVASDENKRNAKERAATAISKVISEHYRSMRTGLSPAFAEGVTWTFYINRLGEILKSVDTAHRLIPDSITLLKVGISICDDNSGNLSYINRTTCQRAARPLPSEWQTFIARRRRTYSEALYSIEPALRPVPGSDRTPTNFLDHITPLHITIAGCALLVFAVLTLLAATSVNNRSNQSPSTTKSSDERAFLNAAAFFIAIQSQQCKSAAESMSSAETAHTDLIEVKASIERSRAKIAESWQKDYLVVASKGIPTKYLILDKRLQDLNRLEQDAFTEILKYWKDRNMEHIRNGKSQLEHAAMESVAISKELRN
jgi:tetratricopeptide (TPR) repeat protein